MHRTSFTVVNCIKAIFYAVLCYIRIHVAETRGDLFFSLSSSSDPGPKQSLGHKFETDEQHIVLKIYIYSQQQYSFPSSQSI